MARDTIFEKEPPVKKEQKPGNIRLIITDNALSILTTDLYRKATYGFGNVALNSADRLVAHILRGIGNENENILIASGDLSFDK